MRNSQKLELDREAKSFAVGVQSQASKLDRRVASLETSSPGRRYLYVRSQPYLVSATVVETAVASIPLVQGSLGETGLIDFEAWWRIRNASGTAYTITLRQKYGASALTLGPYTLAASTNYRFLVVRGVLRAKGSIALQSCMAQVEMYPAYPTTSGAETFNVSNYTEFTEDSETTLAFAHTAQLSAADPFLFAYAEKIAFSYPIPGL